MVFPVHRAMVVRVVATVCAVVGCLLLMGAPAQALRLHVFSSSFGSEGSGSGQFKEPEGVAVNDATHDVYVVDAGNGRVEEFNSTGSEVLAEFDGAGAPGGALVSPREIAVDNSGSLLDESVGDVYVTGEAQVGGETRPVVYKFNAGGVYLGALVGTCENPGESPAEPGGCPGSKAKQPAPFGAIYGVAVDAGGVVWIPQKNNATRKTEIDSFNNVLANTYLSHFTVGNELIPGFAVDPEGNFYAIRNAVNGIAVKYSSLGVFLAEGVESEPTTGVAVDSSSGDLYVDNGHTIAAFTGSGPSIERFGEGHLTRGSGLAVDAANGTIYVADAIGDAVDVFGAVVLPDPVTGAASSLATEGSATLNGTVDPRGEHVTSCQFEYGPEESYGSVGECEPASPSGMGPVAVTAHLSGLTPGTVYHYRLVTGDEHGPNSGADRTFVAPERPSIAEESVSGVTSSAVTLQAQVVPGAPEAAYRFEYGTSGSYGSQIPIPAGSISGLSAVSVSVTVQGLRPGTVYHYRVVAANLLGEQAGADQAFTTQTAGVEFGLPDGRAWELVSPPDKEGAEVETFSFPLGGDMQAAEDGEAVTYVTNAPVGADQLSNPIETQVFSRRMNGAWVSEDIATPHPKASDLEWNERGGGESFLRLVLLGEYMVFSPDLTLAYVNPEGDTPLAPPAPAPKLGFRGASDEGDYVRDNNTGRFERTKLRPEEWYDEQVTLAQGPPRCDASASPAKGEGVDAVSVDGCYVYFNSEAILAPGASGPNPLYVAHDEGGVWTTTFVPFGLGFQELSPNGQFVAFMSTLSLTGYDNRDAVTGQPDEEVYLYDAETNGLVCASCDPTGARPVGQLDVPIGESQVEGALLVDRNAGWLGQRLAGILAVPPRLAELEGSLREPRYLSNGGRLFFDSPVGLVSQDVNGQEDVYEYEPQGEGSCGNPGGCVSLISSGTSSSESALVEASASGDDVFFLTDSQLVGQDYDHVYDMYDAHVCSARVPCPSPSFAVAPPCATGDACRPAPSPQPGVFGVPPSATFNGAGNPMREVAKPGVKKRPKKRVVRKHGKKAKRNQRRSK